MKLAHVGLTLLSWFLMLLSIGLVLLALNYLLDYINLTFLRPKEEIKTTIGIVTDSWSDYHSYYDGTMSGSPVGSESKTATICFVDEDDGTKMFFNFQPVFFNLKEGKKIKVRYSYDKELKYRIRYNKEQNDPTPVDAFGLPANIIYSIERTIIFLIAAMIAFSISFVPRFIKADMIADEKSTEINSSY